MRLSERRKALGFTQEYVARAINTSQPNISNYEEGKYQPKYYLAKKLAELLGCTIEEVMDGCTAEGDET